jgi:hypothetical protein
MACCASGFKNIDDIAKKQFLPVKVHLPGMQHSELLVGLKGEVMPNNADQEQRDLQQT